MYQTKKEPSRRAWTGRLVQKNNTHSITQHHEEPAFCWQHVALLAVFLGAIFAAPAVDWLCYVLWGVC